MAQKNISTADYTLPALRAKTISELQQSIVQLRESIQKTALSMAGNQKHSVRELRRSLARALTIQAQTK